MFKKTDGLGLHQLVHHVAENGAYRIEALISMAYIGQASLVEQYLLHDEDGYSFRQFRASLHDPETKRNNFGWKKEMDDSVIVVLLQDII